MGHNDLEPHFHPKRVDFFANEGIKIKSIAAGNDHCAAVSDKDLMYNWGRG